MVLTDNTRVLFDKTAHLYLLDGGTLLTGLTSLMAKHGLSANYSKIPKARLEAAAAKGTAIHEYLQGIDEGTEVFADSLADEYLEAIRSMGLRHVASEYLVSDNETVATSIDKVYDTGIEGLVDLADIKTTYDYHRRSLEWQLGANVVLFERQNPHLKVRSTFCIHIDKNERKLLGIIPVNPVSAEEFDSLITAERAGLPYHDIGALPSVDDALTTQEVSSLVADAERIVELENTIKLLKGAQESVRAKLAEYMERNGLDKMACEGGTFTLKKSYEVTRVDSSALESKFPSVYRKVLTKSRVKASITFKPKK